MKPPRFLKLMDARPFYPRPGATFDHMAFRRVLLQAWVREVTSRRGVVTSVRHHVVTFGNNQAKRVALQIRRDRGWTKGWDCRRKKIALGERIFVDLSMAQFHMIRAFMKESVR